MKFLEQIEDEALRKSIETAVKAEIESAKETAKNDTEHIKSLKLQGFKEAERKFLRDYKKVFDLSNDDLKDIDTENDFVAVLEVAKTKASTKDAANEWQDKYLNLKKEYNQLKDEQIPALETKAQSEIKAYKIENRLLGKLSSIENLTIDKEDLTLLAKSKMAQLGVILDLEEDKVVAKTKDNTKPIIADKAVDFDGLINHIVTPFIKQNGAGDSGNGSHAPQNTPPQLAHIDSKWSAIPKG